MAWTPSESNDEMWMNTEEQELSEAMEIDAENEASQSVLYAETDTEQEGEGEEHMAELSRLQNSLKNLALLAQSQLQDQPRSTQLALVEKTRKIYNDYANHGSMLGLRRSLADFLADDIEDPPTWSHAEEAAARRTRTHEDVSPHIAHGAPSVAAESPAFLKSSYTFAPQDHMSLYDSFVEEGAGDSSTTAVDSDVLVNQMRADASESMLEASVRTVTSSVHPSQDPQTLEIIKELPFNPSNVTITFPSHLNWPTGLLKHIGNILKLNNAQANALLYVEFRHPFVPSISIESYLARLQLFPVHTHAPLNPHPVPMP